MRPFLVEISYLDDQTYSEFGTDLAKLISHIDHTWHIFSVDVKLRSTGNVEDDFNLIKESSPVSVTCITIH